MHNKFVNVFDNFSEDELPEMSEMDETDDDLVKTLVASTGCVTEEFVADLSEVKKKKELIRKVLYNN